MKKKPILTNKAPTPFGTYSQAIKCNDLLFVSGQLPIKEGCTEIISDDVVEQTSQCFKNIQNICNAAGSNLNDAVKINVYYTDIAASENLNQVMEEFFHEPYPARIRVKVAGLSKNAKVEIDGIFLCKN